MAIDDTHVSGLQFTDQKPILITSSKMQTDVINQLILSRKASRVEHVSLTWETKKCILKYQNYTLHRSHGVVLTWKCF